MTTPTTNTRSAGSWILFAFSAPHAVLSWFLGVLSIVTFFAHKPRLEGAGIMTLKLRDWFSKRITPQEPDDKGLSPYSTTVLRTIWYHEGRDIPTNMAEETDTPHEQHENDHIDLFEDKCFQGFWHGLVIASTQWAFGWYAEAWQPALVWLVIWLLYPVMISTNWVTAVFRYGLADKKRPDGTERGWWSRIYDRAYLDSGHERRARAVTQWVQHSGEHKTWSDREDTRR